MDSRDCLGKAPSRQRTNFNSGKSTIIAEFVVQPLRNSSTQFLPRVSFWEICNRAMLPNQHRTIAKLD
eukprot:3292875-Amphidinium_carterae.1